MPPPTCGTCAAVACSKNKLVEESESEDVGTLGVEFTGPDPETHHYDGDAITVSVTVDDTHGDYGDIVLDWRRSAAAVRQGERSI